MDPAEQVPNDKVAETVFDCVLVPSAGSRASRARRAFLSSSPLMRGGPVLFGHAIERPKFARRGLRTVDVPSQRDCPGLDDNSLLICVYLQRARGFVERGVNVTYKTVSTVAPVAGFASCEHHLRFVDMPADQDPGPVGALADRILQTSDPAMLKPTHIPVVLEQHIFDHRGNAGSVMAALTAGASDHQYARHQGQNRCPQETETHHCEGEAIGRPS